MIATDLNKKDDKKKLAVFQNSIGGDALELFNSFEDEKKLTLAPVLRKFDRYCAPKQNIIFQRYLFNSIMQREGQNFDSFLIELRKGITHTKYLDPEDMIRDRIVLGSSSKEGQNKLLRKSNLTLAINFRRAVEAKTKHGSSCNEQQVCQLAQKLNITKSHFFELLQFDFK